jgi:hypothetical protein
MFHGSTTASHPVVSCLYFINLYFKIVWRLATDWSVRGLNPGGGEIFCTCPERAWAHTASYTLGIESFPGVKCPRRRVDRPPLSNAKVKERMELYLYSPPGPSWPVIGWHILESADFNVWFWLQSKSRDTSDVIGTTKSTFFFKFWFWGGLQPGTLSSNWV